MNHRQNEYRTLNYSPLVLLVFLVLGLCPIILHSQSIKDSTATLPLYEQVHLHLNKTSFVQGERIWFAAYVKNKATAMASTTTQVLHLGLYDDNGKQIKHAAIAIQDGVGQGYMSVDSELTEPQYYLMAYTNYMRNFKALKPYLQIIELPYNQPTKVDGSMEDISVEVLNRKHLVANIPNTIAFAISGDAYDYIKSNSIAILNSKSKVIKSNIAINNERHGRFQMTPKAGEAYTLTYQLTNGESRLWPLPKVVNEGVDLNINSLDNDDLYIHLSSTPSIPNGFMYKDLRLSYLQADGQRITVTPEDSEIKIKIDKASLPFGVNVVKVSLGDSLLLSRSFFNDFKLQQQTRHVDVEYRLNPSKDSVYIYLKNKDAFSENVHLSLSALPATTKAYNPRRSINESFWLGSLASSSRNQSNEILALDSRRNRLNLDLNLMDAAANSQMDLSVIDPERMLYDHEKGFPIKGTVKDADLKTEYQIYGIGRGRNIPFFEEITYDGSFTHEGLFYKGDSLRLSLVDNLGNLRKPNVSLERTSIDSTAYTAYLMDNLEHINTSEPEMTADSTPLVQEPDVTELDEVIIKAKNWMQSSTIALNTAEVVGRRILDDDIKKNPTFGTYMRRLGYRLAISDSPGKYRIISRVPVPGKKGARLPIAIIINGFVQDNNDFNDFPLSRVAAIFHDSFGYIFVNVVLRPGFYDPNQVDNYKPVFLADGLLPPIDYRDPLYLNISSSAFTSYAALHWEANLVLNQDKQIKVVVPLHEQKQIMLHIEGMDSLGRLLNYSQIIGPF